MLSDLLIETVHEIAVMPCGHRRAQEVLVLGAEVQLGIHEIVVCSAKHVQYGKLTCCSSLTLCLPPLLAINLGHVNMASRKQVVCKANYSMSLN